MMRALGMVSCACLAGMALCDTARAEFLVTLRNAYFDAGVNRVARVSDSGSYLGEFIPAQEIVTSGLSGPTGLRWGADGKLIVTSTFGNQVLQFHRADGTFANVLAPGNPAPTPAFDGPAALRFDATGNLLVSNLGSAAGGFMGNSVTVLDADNGGSLGNFGAGHSGATGILVHGDDVYVSELTGNRVLRFNAAGVLQQTIEDPLISGPTGMALDPGTGNLLIASVNGDRIVQFDGTTVSAYLTTPAQFFPSGIQFLDTGNLLVYSAAAGTILKYAVGNPIPSPFIDYVGFGLSTNDLLNGVAVGDILLVGPALPGDFNGNGLYQCGDVDALVAEIVSGQHRMAFDMNADGLVDVADLATWRSVAGAVLTPSGQAIQPGDADLSGTVDGTDFNLWNSSKFTAASAWCSGDFTADGHVDGSDFSVWNSHKFTSADAGQLVPEPGPLQWGLAGMLACMAPLLTCRRGKRVGLKEESI